MMGDDILISQTTPVARALRLLVLGTLVMLLVIPAVNGELLLTDPGENPAHTEDTDHFSGNLNGGDIVQLYTPSVICGHYGLSPYSGSNPASYANKNTLVYFNGNSSSEGINTGTNGPVYNATLAGTQTYYKHIAEAAWCGSTGILKPFRYWNNTNYTPPNGVLLKTDVGENSQTAEYDNHFSGIKNGGENITLNTPAAICGHYGLWPYSGSNPASSANKNTLIYFNGNSTGDGLNTGSNSPVYTTTLAGTQTYYEHIAEAAWCGSTGIIKPYRYWNNTNYTPPSGVLLKTDAGENSQTTEYDNHFSGIKKGGENVTLNTPAAICGHYGLWPYSGSNPASSANKNTLIYFNGNSTGDGLNTGSNSPVYTTTVAGTQTYYEHIAEAAWCGSTGIIKPYRYWNNTNYTPPSGVLLMTDLGENSQTTEFSDHHSGDLSCGENITLNTPSAICGHYGMWPYSGSNPAASVNKNTFVYFNGNSSSDGVNTGRHSPVYTASFDCTKSNYSHVAEAAYCGPVGIIKPYRYWNGISYISHAPHTDFTATPLTGPAPLAVQFNDTSTGGPTTWSWSFGDGQLSAQQNPSHTYAAAGTYNVNLTAANAAGNLTKVRTGYVVVTEPVALTYSMTCIENYDNLDQIGGVINECNNVAARLNATSGWTMNFYNKDGDVTLEDFGTDDSHHPSLVDSTFHYHSGHGINPLHLNGTVYPSIIAFKDYHDLKVPLHWGGLYPDDVSQKWGGNNKWVMLQSCNILVDRDWDSSLTTSHGILGFSTFTFENSNFPNVFFDYAINQEVPIVESFRETTKDVYNNASINGMTVVKTSDQLDNEQFPGVGYTAPDGDPSEAPLYREWACMQD
jgi:PKD repeat protein